jgi:hypothetical protein
VTVVFEKSSIGDVSAGLTRPPTQYHGSSALQLLEILADNWKQIIEKVGIKLISKISFSFQQVKVNLTNGLRFNRVITIALDPELSRKS